MTPMRLAGLAVVSVFATAVVLAGAAASGPSRGHLAAAVNRVVAARAAAATAPPAPALAAPAPQAPAAPAPASPVAEPAAGPVPSASTAGSGTTTGDDAPATPATPPKAKASKVGHVFVIALTGSGYQETFGAQSPMPYLATDLRQRGALLSGFHPLDAGDLPNYLAFAGGLEPTAQTQAECATYGDDGCVQSNTTLSLGDQVTSSGRSWRAYLEGMGDTTCRHPDSGAPDDTAAAPPADGYVTRHNPFVYFHSLLDLGDCLANDLDLGKLGDDLKTARATPNLAFIAPAVSDDPDAFLRTWVPQILGSAAYKKDGALLIAFLSGHASTAPTGALLMSRFARRGGLYAKPYDPYSLLRTVEDLFALDPLGKAKDAASFAKVTLAPAFPPS